MSVKLIGSSNELSIIPSTGSKYYFKQGDLYSLIPTNTNFINSCVLSESRGSTTCNEPIGKDISVVSTSSSSSWTYFLSTSVVFNFILRQTLSSPFIERYSSLLKLDPTDFILAFYKPATSSAEYWG